MGRKKGSKNRVNSTSKTNAPNYSEPIVSVPDVKVKIKHDSEAKNPLFGYTLDEVYGFLKEVDFLCGRGGCLHFKRFHLMNEKGKLECHKCSCQEFFDS